jgi:hypothetical protein
MTNQEYKIVENITSFLVEQNNTVLKVWSGKLTAKQQKNIFGRYLGKGTIVINPETETVSHIVKVCFGTDYDVTVEMSFNGSLLFTR